MVITKYTTRDTYFRLSTPHEFSANDGPVFYGVNNISSYVGRKGRMVLCNYPKGPQVMADNLKDRIRQEVNMSATEHGMYRPYEARIYRFRKAG